MPAGIPYIVGNEAAERFSFYGMRAILVVFMTQYLRSRSGGLAPMSDNDANKWYHIFVASNYFFPIFGAILADAIWGKYRTIFWLSIVYCAGHFALALNDTRLGLMIGLGLIALGSGGIKPCVGRVDDPAVCDSELVEPSLPLHEFLSVRTREREMIEAHATLVELSCPRVGELMQTYQRGTDRPHDVAEGSGVFVEHRLRGEQLLVPRNASGEVADGKRDMRDRREFRHLFLLDRSFGA